MFLYTRAAIDKILSELKRFCSIFINSIQALYIGYLITAIFIPVGIPVVNGILAALLLGYFIFKLVHRADKKDTNKTKSVKHAIKHTKIVLKFISLGVVIYTTAISIGSGNPAVWIMPIITAMLWIISVLFEILVAYLDKRKDLLIDAMKMDAAPIYKANNFLSALKGELPDDDGSVNPQNESLLNELKGNFVQKQAANKKIKKDQRMKDRARRHIAYLNEKATQRAKKMLQKQADKKQKETLAK